MERDHFFDNYKGFLIITVLVGHFLNPLTKESHFIKFIATAIYSFHMPAFVFAAAYFSRRNDLLKLVKTILVPYFIFQAIYCLLFNTIWDRSSYPQLFQPAYSLWFMLSLFCWRALIDKLKLVRYIIPLSYLAGILVAFDISIGAFGSIGRTIAFFPFFILGYKFDKDKFMKFTDRKSIKLIAIVLITIILALIFLKCDTFGYNRFLYKYSYRKSNIEKWGWLYRIIAYAISTSMIYLLACIIPRQKHWYTYLGQRTLSVYLLHGLVLKSIQYMTGIYDKIDEKWEYALLALFAVALTFVLSLKPFHILIRKITQLPLEKLLIKEEK